MIDRNKIRDLCVEALFTEGSHHKQYFLEEILCELDGDNRAIERFRTADAYEKGIAP